MLQKNRIPNASPIHSTSKLVPSPFLARPQRVSCNAVEVLLCWTKDIEGHNRSGPGYLGLEQAIDLARLDVDIDVEVPRGSGQTGYGLDVGSKRVPYVY